MSGFILTRNLKKGKSYEVRLMLNGKQKSKTFKLRRNADRYLARHSNEVHEGTYRELERGLGSSNFSNTGRRHT